MELKSYVPMWLRYRLMDLRGRGVYSHFADEFRCIFIHIPKTAGTSLSETLFGRPSRHVPYFEYEKANSTKFRKYFKFTFVRNPWDRLVSTYFYLKRGGLAVPDRQWADRHLRAYPDFDSFVHGWIDSENIWTWVHFLPQHYFVCDANLVLKMDFVGRMENIKSDFGHVASRLGCNQPLKAANKGTHRDYRQYYSQETREIVGKVYADDIQIFNYRFEGGMADV